MQAIKLKKQIKEENKKIKLEVITTHTLLKTIPTSCRYCELKDELNIGRIF